ncbi:cytochrome c, class I [Dasania marina]|uniref:cytochrome c, class I n=1 Tax=Dasania marina TaxID=471499 RepID=UPI0030D72AB3|tara:strand:- start:53559 stop:53981 length:423 start_codon:yes stop_codon:yes gene_type:complete
MKWLLVLAVAVIGSTHIFALEVNEPRAKFNYQMFCQGCHVGDGSGHKGVPEIKDFIGNFLTFQEGREYLIRVPGSANSALDSYQLAELMNWMIVTYGGSSVPEKWAVYTTEEVEKYRQEPFYEVIDYRKKLVDFISENNK